MRRLLLFFSALMIPSFLLVLLVLFFWGSKGLQILNYAVSGLSLVIAVGTVVSRGRSGRSRTAWTVTSWAASLAGERRNMLAAWCDHLAGDPDHGIVLTPRQQRRYAAGFALAAIRFRLHDCVQPLWHPIDWLLSKDSRTNGCIASIVGVQAIYIVGHGGIPALVTEVWEPCGALGAGLYILARWLRRVRGIELAAISPPPDE